MSLRAARLGVVVAALLPGVAFAQPRPTPVPTPASPATTSAPAPAGDEDFRIWDKRSSGIRESAVSAVAASPSDPKMIVAGTARGVVYTSNDGGRSWNETLRVVRTRTNAATEEIDAATGGDTGTDLTDEQQQELDELRQQTIDEQVDELTEEVGEEEAQRLAEEAADEAVAQRTAEMQEENQSQRASSETDDANGPPARNAAIRSLAWDPTFPGLVYAATRDGVWRSGDGGLTWAQIPVGAGDEDRDAIVVGPSAGSPDRILVGTGSGLLVTQDGGISWARTTGEIANLEIRDIAVDPAARNVVAVGTPNGAFLSIDGGDSFRRVYSNTGESADVRTLAFDPGAGSNLYEGTANGLFLITPDGSVPIGVGSFRSSTMRSIVAPSGSTGHLYVDTARGVYESRDGGKNFDELYRGLETGDVVTLAEDYSSPEGLFAATSLGVYRLVPQSAAIAVAPVRLSGPGPAELVLAAARYARVDGERVARLAHDARIAPWLPQVQVQARYRWDDDVDRKFSDVFDSQGTLIAVDPNGDNAAWNQNAQVTVQLTWNFDELISSTTKQRLHQELSILGRTRTRVLSKVARLARERREVAGRLAAGVADSGERASLELRLQEIEAYLDAATGGALSRSRSDRRKP